MQMRLIHRVSNISINLPAGFEKPVRFASAEEIKLALGIPNTSNPIPAGIIENSDGLCMHISLDISSSSSWSPILYTLNFRIFYGMRQSIIVCISHKEDVDGIVTLYRQVRAAPELYRFKVGPRKWRYGQM